MARTKAVQPTTPKAPKHEVKVSAAAQSSVTFAAKRSADVRLSGTTLSAMGTAAKHGWEAAGAVSEARKERLLKTADAELAKYLMQ